MKYKKSVDQLKSFKSWIFRHEIVFLFFIALIFFWNTGITIFNTEPATGGDTASHYWPLVTLVKEGLPHFSIRVWNPGNLGGEPHLTHYFPLPYLLMAFLSVFLPLGMAFNIGTILPVFAYPFSIYWGLKKAGFKELQPLIGATVCLIFLYNESFSMWGGNALSTLAGQFAHLYGFCFFALGIGYFIRGIRQQRISKMAIFCFAAVLISHFYVALFIPIFFLGFLFDKKTFVKNLKIVVATGFAALLLSAWFVIPMLHNAAWNTAFGLKWYSKNIFLEAFPTSTWPILGLFAASFGYALFNWRRFLQQKTESAVNVSMLILAGSSVLLYFIFPILGLVDIRIFPMLYFSFCFLVPAFFSFWGRDLFGKYQKNFVFALLSGLLMIAAVREIQNFPGWVRWNYSSWSAKSAFANLTALTHQLKGDFSAPRVIYENSELSNTAGTMRVFEMLPYFSQRSTLESVYMQATILAPAAFYMQALISKTPSCPFPNYQCTSFEPNRITKYTDLMAVNQLILIDEDVRKRAEELSDWKKVDQYGIWHLYERTGEAASYSYVDIPRTMPEKIEFKGFKSKFYDWFLGYERGANYLWAARFPESERMSSENILTGEDNSLSKCQPKVEVNFNKIVLKTLCPSKLHILKFAFHPSFRAAGGESLFLLSPGFIGIIPGSQETILEWGHHWLWTLSNSLSWISILFFAAWIWRSRSRKVGSD